MDNMDIKEALIYPVRYDGWFSRLLKLFLLTLLPVIGWFVIVAYMLRNCNRWSNKDYFDYPNFSEFNELIADGCIIFVIFLIYSIPGFILDVIPWWDSIIPTFYFLLLIFISPYIFSRYSQENRFLDAFNFKQLLKFARQNVILLSIIMLINIICTIILLIPAALFIIGGAIIIPLGKESFIWFIIGGAFAGFGIIISLLGLIYQLYIFSSLAGNIYYLWRSKEE
ncbi:hypothetical protein DRQ33_01695 [bacterium]|nr:MAG: hypothetical protein DRQ33_01695 [bacterium]